MRNVVCVESARGSRLHPYYENHYHASLPTIRLVNPDPLIGRVIDGKYELTALLGKGGMSVVYRAACAYRRRRGREDPLGKFVKDDAALARFRREARAAAMLHHPNVITIHDFGETDDELAPAFLVMEFVKGTPLRDLLSSRVRFPIERAVRMMRGICAGVGAAHRQGVVHRDLKPENILVVAPMTITSLKVCGWLISVLRSCSPRLSPRRGMRCWEHRFYVAGTVHG